MLKSARYLNWQCHEDRLIEFDRVTTIVGNNAAGKSALLRGIRWAALNQWDGKADTFITHGTELATIELIVDDHSVIRSKGKGVNLYSLDGRELKAFGQKPPDDVSKTLLLTEDNFQNQKDPAFWLWLNGPDAAKALNKIFSLEEIDDCMTAVAAELRQAKSNVSVIEDRLNEAKQVVLLTEWVGTADQDLAELELLQETIKEMTDEVDSSEGLLSDISKWSSYVDKAKDSLALGEEVLGLADEVIALENQLVKCRAILATEEELCQLQSQLKTKAAKLRKLESDQCPLCGRQ